MSKVYTLESIGPKVDILEIKFEKLQKSVDDLAESFKMMLKIITRMNQTLNEILEENKISNARLNNHEDRISALE